MEMKRRGRLSLPDRAGPPLRQIGYLPEGARSSRSSSPTSGGPAQIEQAYWRPTGVERALTAFRLPIEGRDEWIAAVRRLA